MALFGNSILKTLQVFVFLYQITLEIKQVIAESIISSDLQLSYYIIPTDDNYAIQMWIRILEDDQQTLDSAIFEIKNKNGQATKVIVESLTTIKLLNELNQKTATNWPVPFQSGTIDLHRKATIYEKWLPLVISRSSNNDIYYYTFSDLQVIKEINRDFSLSGKSYITFCPSNLNNVKVLFQNVIYRDVLIDSVDKLDGYIYNNSYLGLYYQSALSQNKKIFYNLNRGNEYKNGHLYLEKIQDFIQVSPGYYSTYTIYVPNFYDSNVYYICQFYQQMNFSFQGLLLNAELNLPVKYILYQRLLSYQNKYFQFEYIFEFSELSTLRQKIQESMNYNDNGIIENYYIQISDLVEIDKKFFHQKYYLISIQNFPQSNFVRQNSIYFHSFIYNQNKSSTHNVDFIYSFYDQISQKCDHQNDINYLVAAQIYRTTIYRDIQYNMIKDNFNEIHAIGSTQQVQLQNLTSHNIKQFVNFNVNSMTEIVEGQLIEISGNLDLCKDIVSYCVFCVDYKCLKCDENFYLVQGICIQCHPEYMKFDEGCYKQNNIFFNDPIQSGIQYDEFQPKVLQIQLEYKCQINSLTKFLFMNEKILESELEVQNLQQQIVKYFDPIQIRISNLKGYYTSGFYPSTFNICKKDYFFQIDDNFYTSCVVQCEEGQNLQQKKICMKNFEGCKIQNENGCQKCLENFKEIQENGWVFCSRTKIEISKNYETEYKISNQASSLQCKIDSTTSLDCLFCRPSFMLDLPNKSCILKTNEFDKIKDSQVCTQYDDIQNPINCIGVTSSNVVQNTTTKKWTVSCNVLDNFVQTCSSCQNSNYYLDLFQNCQECLNYDSTQQLCLQCPQGFQNINGQCIEQSCLSIVKNCTSCDSFNIQLCSSCDSELYLILENDNYQCSKIDNCLTIDYNNYQLSCNNCITGYVLVDKQMQLNNSGILCILQSNYIENCKIYDIVEMQLKCVQCKEFYILINQYFCIEQQNYVQNCLNYDLITKQCQSCLNQSYMCIDVNLSLSNVNCKYCVRSNVIKNNCQKFYSNMTCAGCAVDYMCLDFLLMVSDIECDQCVSSSSVIQNCLQVDVDFNCLQCIQGSVCLDFKYVISQTECIHCLDSIYKVENCQKYDSNMICQLCMTGYQCLTSDSSITTSPCSYCISNNSIISNCQQYDNNSTCIQCATGYLCLDQNYYQSQSNCTQCLNQGSAIPNCYQFDSNLNCLQCQINYTCLSANFDVIDPSCNECLQSGICSFCENNNNLIDSCIKYDNNLKCTQCNLNYFALDDFFQLCSTSCNYCFEDINYVSDCLQYNLNENCIQCQLNYFCIDLQYNISSSICQHCLSDIYQIDNCQQYNAQYDCVQCQQDSFMYSETLQNYCILDIYWVQGCTKYEQFNQSSEYSCTLCDNQIQPVNNSCQACFDTEVYIQSQQICIFKENFIENCVLYDYNQICEECDQQYFLLQIYLKEFQNKNICDQGKIDNCEWYSNELRCFQCFTGYQISQDLLYCVNQQDCTSENCVDESQQQIVYSTIQDNCLLHVDNCQKCQENDKNMCSYCNQDFQLQENKCIYQCGKIDNMDSADYQALCEESNDIQTIQNICQIVIPNCTVCIYSDNQINCLECFQNFILRENVCEGEKILYRNTQSLCLEYQQEYCVLCPQNFYLQKNVCKAILEVNDEIQCLNEVYCYKNQSKINQHCQNCKNQCKITKNGKILSFDKFLVFNANYHLEGKNYVGIIDSQNFEINIQIQDFTQSSTVYINAFDSIYQSINCTPQIKYIFPFQQLKLDNSVVVLEKADDYQQYSSYLNLVFGSQFNVSLQIFFEQIKIFWYINLLGLDSNGIFEKFINQKTMKVQSHISQFFSTQNKIFYFYQYISIRDGLDLLFLQNIYSYLFQQFAAMIFSFCLINMKFLISFVKYKKHKQKLKQTVIQYLLVIGVKMFLDFGILSSKIYSIFQQQSKKNFFQIIIVILFFYLIFCTFQQVIGNLNNSIKSQEQDNTNYRYSKKRIILILNQLTLYKILFLFFKIYGLLVFQNAQFIAMCNFIILSIFEQSHLMMFQKLNKKFRIIKFLSFLNFSVVCIFLFSLFCNQKDFIFIQETISNVCFIAMLIIHLATIMAEKFISML